MAKKVILRLMVVAVMVVLIGTGSAWAFSGSGSGTEGDPYVITSVEQLQEMQNDLAAYYVLGNDIDASGTVSWNGGEGFGPVGVFTGTFDGNRHTINNLHINRINSSDQGLFSVLSGAIVKNVHLGNSNVTFYRSGGILAGNVNSYSVVTYCSATGIVTLKPESGGGRGGGLVGNVRTGSHVDRCFSDVNVNTGGRSQVGGLVGYLRGQGYVTLLTNSYSRGTVTGSGSKQGNLLGDADDSRVDKCYSSGYGKALIGFNWGHPVITNCYWDKDKGASSSSYGGSPRTTSQMMQQATFAGWDFDEIWDIDEEQSYPYFMEPRVLEGLEIAGPGEVAENSNTSYKAIAIYDNNSTKDVTGLAEWSVEPNDIASITAGLLTREIVDLPTDVIITAQYSEDPNTEIAQKDVSIFAVCPSGSALDFDGQNDYVEISNEEIFDVSDKLTLTAWIRPNSFDSRIVSKWKSGNLAYVLYLTPDGNIQFAFSSDCSWDSGGNGPDAWLVNSIETVDTGSWSHCAAVHDGATIRVYVNGNETIRTSVSATICTAGSESVRIGIDGDGYGPFDGLIDEVAIYNKALSAEEIQELMHTRPEAGEPNLVAYWDFDEGEGQVAYDLSSNGNDGVLGSSLDPDDSDPNWTDSIPPVGICSVEGIVERNLLNVLGMKNDVLDILDEAIGKEEALWEYMDIVFKDRDFGNTSKADVVKAKQKIMGAIQQEEQAETAVDQSIDKLDDALDALGIE